MENTQPPLNGRRDSMMKELVDNPAFDIEGALDVIRNALDNEILREDVRVALKRITQTNYLLRNGLASTGRRLSQSVAEISLVRVQCSESMDALQKRLREEKRAHVQFRQEANDVLHTLNDTVNDLDEQVETLMTRNDELQEAVLDLRGEVARLELELSDNQAGMRNAGSVYQ